jgi:transcriptional regulator with XRE-family HTH domain
MGKEKSVTMFEGVWRKLSQGRKYREQFALAFLKRSVPFQVKTLRKKHCGSQAILAGRSGLTQGVVSRAEDQDYGNLTLNTIGRIAGGLDMAFIGRFVPFSELVKFSLDMSEEEFRSIRTFEEDTAALAASGQCFHDVPQDESSLSQRIGPQRVEVDDLEDERRVVNMLNPGRRAASKNNLEDVPKGFVDAMEGRSSHGTFSRSPV